jgi:hypothetical protein
LVSRVCRKADHTNLYRLRKDPARQRRSLFHPAIRPQRKEQAMKHGPKSNVNRYTDIGTTIGHGGLGTSHSAGPPTSTPTSIALGALVLV